jgi:hypothetical protein
MRHSPEDFPAHILDLLRHIRSVFQNVIQHGLNGSIHTGISVHEGMAVAVCISVLYIHAAFFRNGDSNIHQVTIPLSGEEKEKNALPVEK